MAKKAKSFWQNLEEIETENGRRKAEFFRSQPEYEAWHNGRPSAILADKSIPVAERVAKYKEASGPDSEWTKLDEELTRRWSESGLVIAKNLNVCLFL